MGNLVEQSIETDFAVCLLFAAESVRPFTDVNVFQAFMVRPWKMDKNVSRAFTVIHHLDLNTLPQNIHFVSIILLVRSRFRKGLTLSLGTKVKLPNVHVFCAFCIST